MSDELTLAKRLERIENFVREIDRFVAIGALNWDFQKPNLVALAVNNCLRRQRESIDGAIALVKAEQGHLAVAFVRAALEERLWLDYLGTISLRTANSLLLVLTRWDGIRSLVAQRDYIGDEVMTRSLWYPPGFVDAQAAQLDSIRADLNELRAELGWSGLLPSIKWIAEQVDETRLTEYLHSATSRAIHFSAGEVMRRGWGTHGGILVTDQAEFREHLASFALDRLWRLYLETVLVSLELIEDSGVTVDGSLLVDETQHLLTDDLVELGQVPLVHAHEWNLTPEGPLLIPYIPRHTTPT